MHQSNLGNKVLFPSIVLFKFSRLTMSIMFWYDNTWYVYMYVFMFLCIYVSMHPFFMHIWIHVYTYLCIYVSMYLYIYTYIRSNILEQQKNTSTLAFKVEVLNPVWKQMNLLNLAFCRCCADFCERHAADGCCYDDCRVLRG